MNKKTLPIIIRVICVLLCLQIILPSLAVSAFADEGGEVQLSAKPLSYLDNKTFFDFASGEQPVLDSVYAMAINLDTGIFFAVKAAKAYIYSVFRAQFFFGEKLIYRRRAENTSQLFAVDHL